jgi:tRNA-dihydrouridine synthase C
MLFADRPALVLAPMEGVTDAPMRALQGEFGSFTHSVSEFLRVSQVVLPKRVFLRHVPELQQQSRTISGLPVQVQLLGGDPDRLAASAVNAIAAGAIAIDLNFGCPAKTVNRHDGGATLLQYPKRIRDIVSAVRSAVPKEIPVSAKMRLGWDTIDAIDENADMAERGGASWLTIHGRTRFAGYAPPIFWEPIGRVRKRLQIPVIANGDIWTIEDFRRCREMTGCKHFMLGRGALANPLLSAQVATELGLPGNPIQPTSLDWLPLLQRLAQLMTEMTMASSMRILRRVKQWLFLAARHGSFTPFDAVKRVHDFDELKRVIVAASFAP